MKKVNQFIDTYCELVQYFKDRGLQVVILTPHIVETKTSSKAGRTSHSRKSTYPVKRSQIRIINLLRSKLCSAHPDVHQINHLTETGPLHPSRFYPRWKEEITAALEQMNQSVE